MNMCSYLNDLSALRHSLELVPFFGDSNKSKGGFFFILFFIKHLRDTIIWYTCYDAFICNYYGLCEVFDLVYQIKAADKCKW